MWEYVWGYYVWKGHAGKNPSDWQIALSGSGPSYKVASIRLKKGIQADGFQFFGGAKFR